jgi:transposase
MEKFKHIVGADLSKKTIDLFCHQTNKHFQISNSAQGFKEILKWFKYQNIQLSNAMLVMEHTGLYSFCFERFLHQHQISFAKVNALAIKNSLGLVRGKSDKTDAQRIAGYGFEKQATLQAETAVSKDIQRLQLLHATRERLVKQKAGLLNAVKEYSNIGLSKQDTIMQTQTRLIKEFEKQIKKIEAEMDEIIANDESLRRNYQLLKTVKGVGKVAAIAVLIKTRNFIRFKNARKFACHCGTAPFEHTSGSSIKGKTRVSHLADKRMKTLLDLCAKSAIQYDKELREYYLKRVEMGKSKMSTINIVRNKLLYRIFAVVKRQTPFVENYLQAA